MRGAQWGVGVKWVLWGTQELWGVECGVFGLDWGQLWGVGMGAVRVRIVGVGVMGWDGGYGAGGGNRGYGHGGSVLEWGWRLWGWVL